MCLCHNSIRRRRCDALAEVDEVKRKVLRQNEDIARPVLHAVFDLPGLRFLGVGHKSILNS